MAGERKWPPIRMLAVRFLFLPCLDATRGDRDAHAGKAHDHGLNERSGRSAKVRLPGTAPGCGPRHGIRRFSASRHCRDGLMKSADTARAPPEPAETPCRSWTSRGRSVRSALGSRAHRSALGFENDSGPTVRTSGHSLRGFDDNPGCPATTTSNSFSIPG